MTFSWSVSPSQVSTTSAFTNVNMIMLEVLCSIKPSATKRLQENFSEIFEFPLALTTWQISALA